MGDMRMAPGTTSLRSISERLRARASEYRAKGYPNMAADLETEAQKMDERAWLACEPPQVLVASTSSKKSPTAHSWTAETRPRNRFAPGARFRCVYCRRGISTFDQLPSHEAQCDARVIVRRMWAMSIERSKRRLLSTGSANA